MVDLKSLYEDVMEFSLSLREKTFNQPLYEKIYDDFQLLIKKWKLQNEIPIIGFVSFVNMIDTLSIESGSRFLSEEDIVKTEDAHIQFEGFISEIEKELFAFENEKWTFKAGK